MIFLDNFVALRISLYLFLHGDSITPMTRTTQILHVLQGEKASVACLSIHEVYDGEACMSGTASGHVDEVVLLRSASIVQEL